MRTYVWHHFSKHVPNTKTHAVDKVRVASTPDISSLWDRSEINCSFEFRRMRAKSMNGNTGA